MSTSDILKSFPPVSRADARVLILGSMPGAASLAAGQYYAHPRNGFWPIMGALVGAGSDLPYDIRLDRLRGAGVALWDVVGSCRRRGSLDSHIEQEIPNDFNVFFQRHPEIEAVFFNGQAAQSLFRQHVLRGLGSFTVTSCALPSTSPAHAGMSLDAKTARWREAMTSWL